MARLDEDLFERIQTATTDDTIGVRITDRMAALVAPLKAEQDQLRAEKEACRKYVQRLDAQLRRIDRVLRATGERIETTPGKKKKDKPGTGRPSKEKLDAILKLIEDADEPITNKELKELSGYTEATTNAATYWLRREGHIRLAGYGGYRNMSSLFAPATDKEAVAA